MSKQSAITQAVEIVLLPKPDAWPADLVAPTSTHAIQARTQLDLPIDHPIVASGHQPILFHPGIVAKLIALDYWAKKTGAAPVWIVPDQDIVDPGLIRIPEQSGGSLTAEDIRLGGEQNHQSPAAILPPIPINADLYDRLEPVGSWLMGYEQESSLARQFASATIGMLCEQLDLEEPTIIYASDLLQLEATSLLLDGMLNDPLAAIHSYNTSVARFPDAGVRPLTMTDTHFELPFWRLEGNARVPVIVQSDQSGFDRTNLIPRGLMMTAIMRAYLCDLFIHGTGGYEYDRITEHWLNDWQGRELAPITAASATMMLDFDLPTFQDPNQAAWIAHHARHNPALLGDQEAAQKKADLVAAIARSKANGDQLTTSRLFAQLHHLLDETRAKHAGEIHRLDEAFRIAQQSRESQEIASSRTWAFPLYPDEQLQSLKAEIIRALDSAE